MVFIKMLTVLLVFVVTLFLVKTFIKNANDDSETIKPMPGERSAVMRLFSKPEPAQPDPKFSQ